MAISKWEQNFIEWARKNYVFIFLILATIISMVIRFCGRDFVSQDANDFLINWYDEIKENGGILALSKQIGDYNITYQFVIALFTYIPIKSIYAYKIFSVIFDYFMAYQAAKLVSEVLDSKDRNLAYATYLIIIFMPTVFLDSAFWAQCDAVYISWIIIALRYLMKDKYKWSFIFLGVALAFKFQTIFIIPFYVVYYFVAKKYSVFSFAWTFVAFYVLCIPGFIMGRKLWAPLANYFLYQSGKYTGLFHNSASFWRFIAYENPELRTPAVLLTMVILGFGLWYLIHIKFSFESKFDILLVATWFMWTTLLFLPSMHERYSYGLDIFLVLIAIITRKIKFIVIATVEIIISSMEYSQYLFDIKYPGMLIAVGIMCIYILFTTLIIRVVKR